MCPTSPESPPRAAQQPAVDDHAAADADLAGQVDQVGAGVRAVAHSAIAEGWRRSRRAPGGVGAEAGAEPATARTRASPGWARGEDAASTLDQPGTATVSPTAGAGAAGAAGSARPARPPRRAGRGSARGGVEGDAAAREHLAAQVEDQAGDEVDVQLDADAARPPAVEVHAGPGRPTAPRSRRPRRPGRGRRARRPGWRRWPCSGRSPAAMRARDAGRRRAGGAAPARGCAAGPRPGRRDGPRCAAL